MSNGKMGMFFAKMASHVIELELWKIFAGERCCSGKWRLRKACIMLSGFNGNIKSAGMGLWPEV